MSTKRAVESVSDHRSSDGSLLPTLILFAYRSSVRQPGEMKNLRKNLRESADYVAGKMNARPKAAVILGSGLGNFASLLSESRVLSAGEVPHYPLSTVEGHAGKILAGTIQSGKNASPELLVFQGRTHFYESNDLDVVVYPIELAHALGVSDLVVTNAAGGVNRDFKPGDLMLITDYINLSFENPLSGRIGKASTEYRPPFSKRLMELARASADTYGIKLKEGVYCWTKGPSYESASEIAMMKRFGADAVGMSTVPEIIVGGDYGMNVLGISCITNMATGIAAGKLAHEEVKEVAGRVNSDFVKLLSAIVLGL